jgi:hypothetical protein
MTAYASSGGGRVTDLACRDWISQKARIVTPPARPTRPIWSATSGEAVRSANGTELTTLSRMANFEESATRPQAAKKTRVQRDESDALGNYSGPRRVFRDGRGCR